MAASKQTSWLLTDLHILVSLSIYLGALAGHLGCFPLDNEASPPKSYYSKTELLTPPRHIPGPWLISRGGEVDRA